MSVNEIDPFVGVHCETTATGTLLRQLGYELSEPMMFGLGEGLGFMFWKMKFMDFPFIGGRVKQGVLTENIARNLGLELERRETASVKKAWNTVKTMLDEGAVVGLQLDSYYLDYFPEKFHFAGHFAALYGYDDTDAYMIDTKPNGGRVKTSLDSLALARNEKGPMAAKNLMYRLIETDEKPDVSKVVLGAIRRNAEDYLTPPIGNFGFKGVQKTSKEIIKWFRNSQNITHEFTTTAMLMEKAGTGGALFRNLYRDFLGEAFDLTGREELAHAQERFVAIAQNWAAVAALLEKAGLEQDEGCITDASGILEELSKQEFEAMGLLRNIE
ncbi:MAG: BtrH N-terminal domain-containing protein [Rhodobacteraceae bacterium]|nr:BtrH N-terminal domain-containing protein [Paracoccaceae bacterium]